MQTETGYRLEVVTVRKLEFETDGFAFGDKILARWYPDKAEAEKKGIMIVITTGKDGAITGGPAFIQVKDDPDILTRGTHNSNICCISCNLSSLFRLPRTYLTVCFAHSMLQLHLAPHMVTLW